LYATNYISNSYLYKKAWSKKGKIKKIGWTKIWLNESGNKKTFLMVYG